MKKIIILLSILIMLSGCGNKKEENTDALKFKEEYSMIDIYKENPYVYSNKEEVLKLLNKTGVIYIGSSDNKESIELLKKLNEAVDNTGISKVYYLNNNYEEVLKKINKTDIPVVIFVKDGKIIESDNTTKSYELAIHEVLDDLCDKEC